MGRRQSGTSDTCSSTCAAGSWANGLVCQDCETINNMPTTATYTCESTTDSTTTSDCVDGYDKIDIDSPMYTATWCDHIEFCPVGQFGNDTGSCKNCTDINNAESISCEKEGAAFSRVVECESGYLNEGSTCSAEACGGTTYTNASGQCAECTEIYNATSYTCTELGKSTAVSCIAGLVRTQLDSGDTCEEKCDPGYEYADIFDEQCYPCGTIANATGARIVCQERRRENRFETPSNNNCDTGYQQELYGIGGDKCIKENWGGAGHYPNNGGNCSTCPAVANTIAGTKVTCVSQTTSRIDASAFTSDANFTIYYPSNTNKQDAIQAYKAQQCNSIKGNANKDDTDAAIFYSTSTTDVCVEFAAGYGSTFNTVSTAFSGCPSGTVLNKAFNPKSTTVQTQAAKANSYSCTACPQPGTDSVDFHRATCTACTRPASQTSAPGFLFDEPNCKGKGSGLTCDAGFDFISVETGCPARYVDGGRRLLRGKK